MFLVGSAFHLLSAAFGDAIRVVYRIETGSACISLGGVILLFCIQTSFLLITLE